MKMIRPFLIFLVFVVIAGAILSLMVPASQQVEKTITIQAPASAIYEQLSKLEHFNNWSVWSRQDSSATYILSGKDGTVGATSSWKGDPGISGEGKIEITGLEQDRKVSHSFHFIKPRKANAGSVFTIRENNGLSTVTWNFKMATPRPWNIFNLFYSMSKQMGKDFELSLQALKEITEQQAGTAPQKTYEVLSMDFPATTFATIRQQVKWDDVSSFFAQHIAILNEAAANNNLSAGSGTSLYFVWDEKNQQTDMAAAIPVPAGTQLKNTIIRIVDIPASKAVYVTYNGDYSKLGEAHSSIDRYLAENKLTQKIPVIEQYISGPMNEKDTAKWLTRIVYLVE